MEKFEYFSAINSSNLSNWINFSLDEWDSLIREQRNLVQNVSLTTEIILIAVYSALIVVGVTANLLVSVVVTRPGRRSMLSARNMYIVNLSVSDISLCLICMPFTLVMILRREWTLGPVLCKLVHVIQATNIMVSVGTITAIALDRYFTICKRSAENPARNRRRVIVSILLIWLLSLIASLPLFFFQGLEPVSLHEVVLYEACIEQWPSQAVRVVYDASVLLVMAVMPPTVVAIVHACIAAHLTLHTHAASHKDKARTAREIRRNKRTTYLLFGIVITFATSWLPLGIFSLLADFIFTYDSEELNSPHEMYTALAIVHICAMTSAISNPIVYGWMNLNVRQEFLSLLPQRMRSNQTTQEIETRQTHLNTDRRQSVALLVGTNRDTELQSQI